KNVKNLSYSSCASWLIISALICAFSSVAIAQELINARIVGNRDKILIGDPVQIEITFRHRAGENYQLKVDPRGLGFLELRGQPDVQTRAIDGQSAETRIELTAVPFKTGKVPIPPLIITRSRDGAELRTPSLEMDVEAITTPADREIK